MLPRLRLHAGGAADDPRDPPVAAIRPVAARPARSAVVAIAVLALAQHRRWAGLMLVDADGEIADDVLVDAQEALDLDHRLGGRGDVQQREVGLAVLLDAEGKRLQTPRLNLGDGAAEGGDLGLDLLRQRLDLLLRDVLARQEDMLIKSHCWAFPIQPRPTRSPSSPGKARTGSFEGGNTGGRALKPCRTLASKRAALRSAPGGTQRGGPHIETSARRQGKIREKASARIGQGGCCRPRLSPGFRLASGGGFETEKAIRWKIVKFARFGPIGRTDLDDLGREFFRRAQR